MLIGDDNIVQQKSFKSNYSFHGTPGFNNNPDYSHGTQAFSFNFTPKLSNSLIYLESSCHTIYETSNHGDMAFVLAYYDTTTITINYTPISYQIGTLNFAVPVLQGSCDSWGTTQKTIGIKFGMNGTNVYYNKALDYPAQHGGANGNNYIYYTVREIA
tara:strand:+ start:597 stop:1070 length:474 start_codon:yes stop_codon:yes gene_type:complete